MGMLLLKGKPAGDSAPVAVIRPESDDAFSRIRCPHCRWQPRRSDRWYCDPTGTPEPFLAGCRTTWNTFATRGRCPGCGHLWRWTKCLRCGGWSLHERWYEER